MRRPKSIQFIGTEGVVILTIILLSFILVKNGININAKVPWSSIIWMTLFYLCYANCVSNKCYKAYNNIKESHYYSVKHTLII